MQWLPRLFRARPGPTAWAHLAPLRRTLASEIRGSVRDKEVTHDELAHSLFAPNPEWVGRLKDEGIAPEDAVAVLAPFVSAQRKERMKHIAQRRNSHIACVLEGLYDVGNIAAVFRSAEAFGVEEMYLINKHGDRFKKARTVSVGAEKWLKLHHFHDTAECYAHLRANGFHIAVAHGVEWVPRVDGNWDGNAGTAPESSGAAARDAEAAEAGEDAEAAKQCSLKDLDMSLPTAFVFGNEYAGISEEALALADTCFQIDTFGFVQSLNVSVAAGIVFHAMSIQPANMELAAETVVAQRLTEMYARTLVAKGWSLEQLARACKDRIEERSVKID